MVINANVDAPGVPPEEPGGFFNVAEPLIVTTAKRQLQSDFGNLKD